MPKRMENVNVAIKKLDKASAYKAEALDTSIENVYQEIVEIKNSIDKANVALGRSLEKFYGLSELSSSIKELTMQKASYENVKSLNKTTQVPEVKEPEEKSRHSTTNNVESRISTLEEQMKTCLESVNLINACALKVELLQNHIECLECDLVNHVEKGRKYKLQTKIPSEPSNKARYENTTDYD